MTTTLTQGCEVRPCTVAELFEDQHAPALFREYERECANAALGQTFPSRDLYENLEKGGFLQCYSVRRDGLLYGFAATIVGVLPHYGYKCGTVDSLYVAYMAREWGLGTSLMRFVEDELRKQECRAMFYTAPVNSRLARLLFLCGDEYKHTNHVFTKRLQ